MGFWIMYNERVSRELEQNILNIIFNIMSYKSIPDQIMPLIRPNEKL